MEKIFPREKALKMALIDGFEKEVEMLLKIEKALGINLSGQQIYYIVYGHWRRTGETTAKAIREYIKYVEAGTEIIITPLTRRRMKIECEEKVNIYKKIMAAGLPEIKIRKER